MRWDLLAAARRGSMTLQLDCHDNPAKEEERQFWWNFDRRERTVHAQIEQWEAAGAPMVCERAVMESRLTELRQHRAFLHVQAGQSKADCCPARPQLKASNQNPGHDGVLTTFLSYGTVAQRRQVRSSSRWRQPTRIREVTRRMWRGPSCKRCVAPTLSPGMADAACGPDAHEAAPGTDLYPFRVVPPMRSNEKLVLWLGSSKKDLMALPIEVRKFFGHALDFAQHGDRHDAAKVLKGFGGAGVLEIVEDDAGGTYRAVYT